MAKAKKKSVKKAIKKVAKKAAKKVAKKAPKKAVKKIAKRPAKKVVKKKAAKKVVKRATPKPVQLSGKRFLVIYHAPMEAMEQMAGASVEDQAAGMQSWMDWANRVGERMVDLGAPLMNGQRVDAQGKLEPSTKDVTGYSVILADDLDHLLQLLESNPHISGWHPDATVEVHETVMLPGM